jgi:hypothetical protein
MSKKGRKYQDVIFPGCFSKLTRLLGMVIIWSVYFAVIHDMYSIVIYNNLYKLSVLSTRSVVSSNPAEDEVYNIMFVSFRIGM